jgi:hypothetical protein
MEPGALPDDIHAACEVLGAERALVYLIDPRQRELVLVADPCGGAEPLLSVDGSVAGRAFLSGEVVEMSDTDPLVVWVPLVDGADRLGVLGVTLRADAGPRAVRPQLVALASLTAELLVSKSQYTDLFRTVVRREPMTLAAEIQWGLIPPLTFSSRRVSVAGVMEPAYALGGDTFDYSVNGDTVHLAIFDAVGHGLDAVWPVALAVFGTRHSRCRGLDLPARYAAADEAVRAHGHDHRFVTAQLAELQLSTGRLRWINAGHPAPLLVRDRRVIGPLSCTPSLPLGLGGSVSRIADVGLQPDDRVVWFTDGVVEGRRPGKEPFGLERFANAVERESLAGTGPPETMRRLARSVLDHHAHELTDDFTILMLEYRGP